MKRLTEWEKQEVEGYLKQLPAVKDRRTKEEVFQAVQKKLMDEGVRKKQQKAILKENGKWRKFTAWMPAVAAAVILLILLPSFLKDMEDSAGDINMNGSLEVMEEQGAGDDNDFVIDDFIPLDFGGVLFQEEKIIPVPTTLDVSFADGTTEFQTFIDYKPLSFFSDKEDVEGILVDILTSSPGLETVFWGLQKIEMNEDKKIVTLDFSEENRLASLATGQKNTATSTVTEVFSLYGMEQVQFRVNGVLGVQYGGEGTVEGFDLLPENRGYYLYTGENQDYLIRGVALEEPLRNQPDRLYTFPETLAKMKQVQSNAWYAPVIPAGIEIWVEEGAGSFVIHIDSSGQSINEKEFLVMMRAILLAAADFSIDELVFEGEIVEAFTGMDALTMVVPLLAR